MTANIPVLETEEELTTAANLFRAAMVGFAPLSGLDPGRIGKLLEPGRTLGAFVADEWSPGRTRRPAVRPCVADRGSDMPQSPTWACFPRIPGGHRDRAAVTPVE